MLEVLICGTLAIGSRKSFLFWRRWCARLRLWGVSKIQACTYLSFSYMESTRLFDVQTSRIKFMFPTRIGIVEEQTFTAFLIFLPVLWSNLGASTLVGLGTDARRLFSSLCSDTSWVPKFHGASGWLYMTKLLCMICMCEKISHSKNIPRAMICWREAKTRRAASFLLFCRIRSRFL